MNRIEKLKAENGRLMTLKEGAAFYRVSQPTLRRALERGEVKGVKIGSLWRVCGYPPKMGVDSSKDSKEN